MNITLRKAKVDDINFLNEIRGKESSKLNDDRFIEQDKGKSLYLLAFQEGKPVGHIYVRFSGSEKYHNCPILQDLYVSKKFRGRGIGTKIVQDTELYLKNLGYGKISLDVETNEEWVRKFYEKQGFKLKSGPHKIFWTEKDTNEKINMQVFHLEKEL